VRKLTIGSLLVLTVFCVAVFLTAPRGAHYRFRTEKERGFAFSPYGTRFAMWEQNTLRVYDTGSSRERAVLPFPGRGLGFTADARHFAGISTNEELTVRNAESGDELFRAPLLAEHVTEFASSRNGLLAIGHIGGTVQLYELSTGKSAGSIRADSSNLRALALSSDGRQLVSHGSDGLCFWDVATRTRRHALPAPWHCWRLAFSPDGSMLCSLGSRGCRLWDSATAAERPCACPEEFEGGDWASALAFSSDGHTLLAATSTDVGLWDVRTGAITQRLPNRSHPLFLPFPDRLKLGVDSMGYNPLLEAGTITPKGDVMMLATRRNAAVVWRLASVDVR
jgi:WD40 repeat protein